MARRRKHDASKREYVEPRAMAAGSHDTIRGDKNVHIVHPAIRPPPVPMQLPGRPSLVGREAELERLDQYRHDIGPDVSPIVLITGLASVGKSALAIDWAYRILPDFPHGALYIDLRGFGRDRRVTPAEALTRFLSAIGVDDKNTLDLDASAELFRSSVARRKLLLVLDNAADDEQVRPLLPSGCDCLTIITSQNWLTGLLPSAGGKVHLGPLTPNAAITLLKDFLCDDRVDNDPIAAAELVRHFDYVPHALRICAANLTLRGEDSLTVLVEEFKNRIRPHELTSPGAEPDSMKRAFDLVYDDLGPAERRVARRIGLAPSGTFTVEAIAALDGTPVDQVRRILESLASRSLVDYCGTNRFGCNDLPRD